MEQDESRISCYARKYMLKNDRREKKNDRRPQKCPEKPP